VYLTWCVRLPREIVSKRDGPNHSGERPPRPLCPLLTYYYYRIYLKMFYYTCIYNMIVVVFSARCRRLRVVAPWPINLYIPNILLYLYIYRHIPTRIYKEKIKKRPLYNTIHTHIIIIIIIIIVII